MSRFPVFKNMPAPRYCPQPDPAFPFNEGREIAAVTHLLGSSLQPWQRMVINRATQWRPARDVMGRSVREYKYTKVLVSVPRQSGKTFLTGPVQLWRMLQHPGEAHMYTAQTGADAGMRVKELITLVTNSPAGGLFRPRLSNGSEGLTVLGTGASLTRFSPTLSSVHGGHPPLATLDEIWKYTAELGNGLLGAISPSQSTVRQKAQIWMISTKGTAKSEFMNDLILSGVKGEDESLCYIEFSMPEGMDPYSPETWWTFHPALGNTISEESLRADTGLPYAEWMRGYMNVVVAAENPIIALEDWDHLADTDTVLPSLNDCAVSWDVAPSGQCAAVVAAWTDPLTMTPHVKVLRQRPGTAWLVPLIQMIARRWPGARLYADDGGPTRRITDHLRGLDDFDDERLTTLTMTDRGVADGNLLAAVTETGALRHDGSQALRLAVANAVMRTSNAVERLDRDKSTAPVAALIAASVALWGTTHAEGDAWAVPTWVTEA